MSHELSNEIASKNSTFLIKHQLVALCILVLCVFFLRVWQITHTEVAARDSIGFIRYAWALENTSDWKSLVKGAHQHPGFPVSIYIFSVPVRFFVSSDLPLAFQISSQLSASFFSVLLVIPLFVIGREIFNAKVGFWAVILFEFLPASSKVLGDGLSEGMFLFFAAASLALVLLGFKSQRQGKNIQIELWFFAGLAAAASYLVRPEGMILFLATALVLTLFILIAKFPTHLQRMKQGFNFLGLVLGFSLLALPFILTIGKLTTKPTGQRILEHTSVFKPQVETRLALLPKHNHVLVLLDQPPLFASWWEGDDQSQAARFLWSFLVLGDSYLKGLNYLGCLFAFVGLVLTPRETWKSPEMIVLVLSFFILNVVFFRVALVMGYLSERHAMLALMLIVLWVSFGAVTLGDRIVLFFENSALGFLFGKLNQISFLLLILILPSLWKNLETLHYNREGFKQAGKWIAENTNPGDIVEDPFCWSHYFAGRVFLEGKVDLKTSVPSAKFVVVERSANPHFRLQTQDEETLKAQDGKAVFEWVCSRKGLKSSVLVYAVPLR